MELRMVSTEIEKNMADIFLRVTSSGNLGALTPEEEIELYEQLTSGSKSADIERLLNNLPGIAQLEHLNEVKVICQDGESREWTDAVIEGTLD
ncbi:MAG: hypothetical protein M1835_008081 [Candelina submexicana]|nr:MAG: hypothetical protein M1835_008081 [Candelina submexicana]